MSVSVLVKNSCATIGEGPHWEESTKTLLYVDIYSGEIHKYDTVSGTNSKIAMGDLQGLEGHSGLTMGYVVPRRSGGYMAGVGRGLYHIDWDACKATEHMTVEQGTENRFNDGKCDPSGRMWAGTMGPEIELGKPKPLCGTLYSVENDGTLNKHLHPVSISNGLAWSRDNRTMYFVDSEPRQTYAYDFDIDTGKMSNKRVVADWSNTPIMEMGAPDGMTIDEEGKLWVACFLGSKVVRLDPETGTVLQSVHFPAPRITSCCFGGPNYDELFVTSCRMYAQAEELAAYPLAGSVFKVTGLGVKGLPPHEYLG